MGEIVASNKGRSALGWILICLFLTPLAILILLALPNLAERRAKQAVLHDTKPCPKCAERVLKAAQVCRYCGHEFTPERPIDPSVRQARAAKELIEMRRRGDRR